MMSLYWPLFSILLMVAPKMIFTLRMFPTIVCRFLLCSYLLACGHEQIIEKQENIAPVIVIVSHSDSTPVTEGPSTIRATVSDDDNQFSDITTAWYLNQEVVCDWTPVSSTGEALCALSFAPGNANLVAEVRDTQGASGRAEINLQVEINTAPIANITSPISGQRLYANSPIRFEGTVDDAEDIYSMLQIEWSSDLIGNLGLSDTVESDGTISDIRGLPEGEHVIQLQVTDSLGKKDTDEVLISIGPENTVPICRIDAPIDQYVHIFGNALNIEAFADDPDIDNANLVVTLSSNIAGVFATPTAAIDGSIFVQNTDLAIGRHSIRLDVEDEMGAVCTASTLVIVDTVPTIEILSPQENDMLAKDTPVTFEGRVFDTEDLENELHIEWSSDVDGLLWNTAPTNLGRSQFSTDTLQSGAHTITFWTQDSVGLENQETLHITINTPPTAPTISFMEDPTYVTSTLGIQATGSQDIDGQTITHAYTWWKNGIATTHNTQTIPTSELTALDTWMVRVTSFDGYNFGGYTEANITISNSEPYFQTAPYFTPSTPEVTDTLSCNTSIMDADDGALVPTYLWETDGQIIGNTDTITLDPSMYIGQNITCTVSATDAHGATLSSTISVAVVNTPPNITSPTITSSLFYINDIYTNEAELDCTSTITDVNETIDGSFHWLVNGQEVLEDSHIVLSDTAVLPADVVTCVVEATDSEGATTTVSTSITICDIAYCQESLYLGSGFAIDFQIIPGGSFVMGASPAEVGRDTDENQFPATLSNEFLFSTTEITQGMYESLMGNIWTNGQSVLYGVGDDHPVNFTSWHMAADFSNHLTQYYNQHHNTALSMCYSCQSSGTSGVTCITLGNPYQCTGFRLPTEAEWEYVAKAGGTHSFDTEQGGGNIPGTAQANDCTMSWNLTDGSALIAYAWYCASSIINEPKAVAQKLPNSWQMYDMHGNVAEWCHDGYQTFYPINPTTDYVQLTASLGRVFRGGDWNDYPQDIRAADRNYQLPVYRRENIGFRVVRIP